MRHFVPTAVITVALAGALSAAAAANSNAKPATGAERAAIIGAYRASDGNPSPQVRAVFVSRSNPNLAVVCARTPEAGTRAYVFSHQGHTWHYATSGPAGKAGDSAAAHARASVRMTWGPRPPAVPSGGCWR